MIEVSSFLDKFNSIDELREFIESLRGKLSDEDYDLILYVSGLLDNQAISDDIVLQGQVVRIDHYLVPMIQDINQQGIITLASCSGLQEEHRESKFKPGGGYLAISFNNNLFEFLQNNIADSLIEVTQGNCYFKHSILIYIRTEDDTKLKEGWKQVWNELKQWIQAGNRSAGQQITDREQGEKQ